MLIHESMHTSLMTQVNNLMCCLVMEMIGTEDWDTLIKKLLKIPNNQNIINISGWDKSPSVCISCQSGKSCKLPYSLNNKIVNVPLLKIHFVLWGLLQSLFLKVFAIMQFLLIIVPELRGFIHSRINQISLSSLSNFINLQKTSFLQKSKFSNVMGAANFNHINFLTLLKIVEFKDKYHVRVLQNKMSLRRESIDIQWRHD